MEFNTLNIYQKINFFSVLSIHSVSVFHVRALDNVVSADQFHLRPSEATSIILLTTSVQLVATSVLRSTTSCSTLSSDIGTSLYHFSTTSRNLGDDVRDLLLSQHFSVASLCSKITL